MGYAKSFSDKAKGLPRSIKVFWNSDRLSRYLPHYIAVVVTAELVLLGVHI